MIRSLHFWKTAQFLAVLVPVTWQQLHPTYLTLTLHVEYGKCESLSLPALD